MTTTVKLPDPVPTLFALSVALAENGCAPRPKSTAAPVTFAHVVEASPEPRGASAPNHGIEPRRETRFLAPMTGKQYVPALPVYVTVGVVVSGVIVPGEPVSPLAR